MTGKARHRRVVTGLNASGKSCILEDGPIPATSVMGGIAWRTEGHPADNSAQEAIAPEAFAFDMMNRGTIFMVNEFPPDMDVFWHVTDTIDYIVMLEGEVVLMLENGEVTLRKGDCIVDRGVNHAWRNDSGATAVSAIVTIPAKPVGKGRSV